MENYSYMKDLLKLDRCCPLCSGKVSEQEGLPGVFTLLNLSQWESMLADHLGRKYVEFILNGIRDGFLIGFSRAMGGELPLASAQKNMKSAEKHH